MNRLPVPVSRPDAEHRFFVFDAMNGDHYYFAAPAERDVYAAHLISTYLDDGWDESVEQVMAGELTHLAQQVDRIERPPADQLDGEGYDAEGRHWQPSWSHYCDYALQPLEGVEGPSGGLLAVAVDESKLLTLTVDPWVDDMRPGVVVKDGVLVIAVTTDALLHGITLGGGWPTNERGATVAIQDGALMVKDVVNELLREDEQGTTAVHRLFDEAAVAALDNGSEAVDYDTWVPA